MYSQKKHITIMFQAILCCFLLASCYPKTQSSNNTKNFKTLSEITKPSKHNPSFAQKFSKVRSQTELIDDPTERMLNRHKTWFALDLIAFLWLTFQSLSNYRQD